MPTLTFSYSLVITRMLVRSFGKGGGAGGPESSEGREEAGGKTTCCGFTGQGRATGSHSLPALALLPGTQQPEAILGTAVKGCSWGEGGCE